MTLLEKILYLIKKNGLSDLEFTERVGLNKTAVTEWKKERTKSYNKHIPKIAEVLGVDIDDLLEDSGSLNNGKFASRLRQLKAVNEIPEVWISAILQASPDEYKFWEQDGILPDKCQLEHISHIYNISVEYLIGESDDPLPVRVLPEHCNTIKRLRRRSGLTRAQLAYELNVPMIDICMLEMDFGISQNNIAASQLNLFANYFGVSVDHLLDPKKPATPEGEQPVSGSALDLARRITNLSPQDKGRALDYLELLESQHNAQEP